LPSTLEPGPATATGAPPRARGRSLRRLRAATGLGALALLLATGVASTLHRSGLLIADARRWAALGELEARRLAFGAAYVDAIESIRRELPPATTYLLVPGDSPAEAGWELWVRYDLAPRRPILIRSRERGGLQGPGGSALPRHVAVAVVRGPGDVPSLLARDQLLARRPRRDGDR
jgi:hypothetical protein